MNGRLVRTLRIAVLSYTRIARDHRVLRTLETLSGLGHDVTAIGFGEAPALPVAMIRLPDLPGPARQRLEIAATQFPANLIPASASFLHMLVPQHRAARTALLALRPDIVHANDWPALVAAEAAKRNVGARIVYDSHELASEEHADNRLWRLVAQRHTRAIESGFIRQADAVVTVSDGIAATLRELYDLPELPLVIRNAPAYRSVAPAALAEPLRLLFHGIMKGGRGIEALIGSLALLPHVRLTLRGDGAPRYLAGLQALAARLGVSTLVSFEPAVPHEAVVEAAAGSHIGVFCAHTDTRQNRFAMPNKVYEYLMAGLAVLVTDGTDLAALVREHDCGLTATESSPEAIAAALRALSLPELERMRTNALASARRLSWDEERLKLIGLYDRLTHVGQARHVA